MPNSSDVEAEVDHKLINFKDEFSKNIIEVLGLVLMLIIIFVVFGIAGRFSGNFTSKIEQVRSLGDPRVIYPFAYIYFIAMTIVLFLSPKSRAHRYFLSICSLSANGLFFFFSLMAAHRIYFYQTLTFGVFAIIILFLVVPVFVDAASRYYESKATDRGGRILTGIFIFVASIGILI